MAQSPKYVTEEVITYMLEEFKDKIIELVDDRIATVLDAECTDDQLVSAKAVFDAIENARMDVEPIFGSIMSVTPKARTLYFRRDDELDTTCDINYHTGEEWIRTGGDVEGDKDNFYSKDELEGMTVTDMSNIFGTVFSGDDSDGSSDSEPESD